MNRTREDCGRVERGYVRRRHDPARIRLVEPEVARPPLHLKDFEVAPHAPMLVEHSAQLAGGHPVPRRKRKLSDEGFVAFLKYVAFHGQPSDRVRAVADDNLFAQSPRCTHTVGYRVNERVYATADVL